MNIGKIEQLTQPPPLYPDDESVLRAQIKKLVQENQRLEREVERLNERLRMWGLID